MVYSTYLSSFITKDIKYKLRSTDTAMKFRLGCQAKLRYLFFEPTFPTCFPFDVSKSRIPEESNDTAMYAPSLLNAIARISVL